MSHQDTLSWSQGPGLDSREPLFLNEFLSGDSWEIVFQDAAYANDQFSDGFRGFQQFVMTDFVTCLDETEVVEADKLRKLQAPMEVCRTAVLQALTAIDAQHAFEDSYAGRVDAATTAAKKIIAAKKDDPEVQARRVQVTETWLSSELAKLRLKKDELQDSVVSATTLGGHQLQRFFQYLEKCQAFSKSFLDKLEVWKEMDATQRGARDVLLERMAKRNPGSLEETYKHIEQLDTLVSVEEAEQRGCLEMDLEQCAEDDEKLSGDAYMVATDETEHDKIPDSAKLGGDDGLELSGTEQENSTEGHEILKLPGSEQEKSTEDDKDLDSAKLGGTEQEKSTERDKDLDSAKLGGTEQEKSTEHDKKPDSAKLGGTVQEKTTEDDKKPDSAKLGGTVQQQSTEDDKEPDSAKLGGTVQQQATEDDKEPDSAKLGGTEDEKSTADDKKLDSAKLDEKSTEDDKKLDSAMLGGLDESVHPVAEEDGYECVSDTDSIIAVEDSLLEHSLSKLMLKDFIWILILCSCVLQCRPLSRYLFNLFLSFTRYYIFIADI